MKRKELRVTKEAVLSECFITVGNKPNKLEVMTSQKPKRQGNRSAFCPFFFFIKCILAKVD